MDILEQYRAEQAEKEAAKKAKLEAEQKAKRAQFEADKEEQAKSNHKQAWLDEGGNAEDFENAWPGMYQEYLKQQAMSKENQARRSQAKLIHSVF